MDEIYIKTSYLNSTIAKYFEGRDLITVEDLLSRIEDFDYEIENLKEQIEEYENEDSEDKYIGYLESRWDDIRMEQIKDE